MGSQAGIQNWR